MKREAGQRNLRKSIPARKKRFTVGLPMSSPSYYSCHFKNWSFLLLRHIFSSDVWLSNICKHCSKPPRAGRCNHCGNDVVKREVTFGDVVKREVTFGWQSRGDVRCGCQCLLLTLTRAGRVVPPCQLVKDETLGSEQQMILTLHHWYVTFIPRKWVNW